LTCLNTLVSQHGVGDSVQTTSLNALEQAATEGESPVVHERESVSVWLGMSLGHRQKIE